MQESKFLKIVIVCLLLLNFGTIGYLLLNNKSRDDARPEREDAAAFLQRTLNLTDEQEAQYRRLRDGHHAEMMQERRELRGSVEALYGLLSDPRADSAAVAARINEIADAHRKTERITFEHFKLVRAICTPAQQRQFDKVIVDALNRMGGGGPPRGQHPPHQP